MKRFSIVLVAVVTGGCVVEEDHSYRPGPDYGDELEDIVETAIDTGEALTAEPGSGAGVFIAYQGDGWWQVFTACDTDDPVIACGWDVGAQADEEIEQIEGEDLEPDDVVFASDPRTVIMYARTSKTNDGFTFRTTPGAAARVEAWLDGNPDPRFIFWIGDGVVRRGAPSNPIDLVPSEP